MENTKLEVPLGDSKEEIKAREQIISDVYRKWYEENPSKAVYNNNLKENIVKTAYQVGKALET